MAITTQATNSHYITGYNVPYFRIGSQQKRISTHHDSAHHSARACACSDVFSISSACNAIARALALSPLFACACSSAATCRADATLRPAPRPVAVAAPTAFANIMVDATSWLRMYPSTIAAAKESPQPTESVTSTFSASTCSTPSLSLVHSNAPLAPSFTMHHCVLACGRDRMARAAAAGCVSPVTTAASCAIENKLFRSLNRQEARLHMLAPTRSTELSAVICNVHARNNKYLQHFQSDQGTSINTAVESNHGDASGLQAIPRHARQTDWTFIRHQRWMSNRRCCQPRTSSVISTTSARSSIVSSATRRLPSFMVKHLRPGRQQGSSHQCWQHNFRHIFVVRVRPADQIVSDSAYLQPNRRPA